MIVFAVLTTHARDELPGATAYLNNLMALDDALAAYGWIG
jgi:hypothetical protein